MAKKTPKKGYHHGDLRRALIDSSLELIQEKGAVGLTLREAARRVGVSHAAPYRHFTDKDALLAAVAEEGYAALFDAMESAKTAGADAVTQLPEIGIAYVQFALAHPNHFEVMFGIKLKDHDAAAAAGQRAFGVLVGTVEQMRRDGTLRDGDPVHYAYAAWAAVHGLSLLLIKTQLPRTLSADALAELVTGVVQRGVRA